MNFEMNLKMNVEMNSSSKIGKNIYVGFILRHSKSRQGPLFHYSFSVVV